MTEVNKSPIASEWISDRELEDRLSPYTRYEPSIIARAVKSFCLGIAGVVVYRVNSESYYVYDRMCPHERSTSSLVTTIKGEEAIVACPTCGSRFLLSGGGADVVNGPAVYPLKSYNNRYEASDNTLSVWN